MKPGKKGLARIFDATAYSMKGIAAGWKHEAAFRQELILSLVLLPFSFLLAANPLQWLLLVFPLLMFFIILGDFHQIDLIRFCQFLH